MIKYDYHMHSNASYDSDAKIESMIERAIDLNFHELAFTEHADLEIKEKYIIQFENYIKKFEKLKNSYAKDIKLVLGVEIAFTDETLCRFEKYLKPIPFDFAILSVHSVFSQNDVYNNVFLQNKSKNKAYSDYFKVIIERINKFRDFSVIGHLDYIARYGTYADLSLKYEHFSELLDELMLTLIKYDKGLEINTSSFRKNDFSYNFYKDLFKRFKELGGKILTVGSDAHSPEYIGANFDLAEEVLDYSGFNYFCRFENKIAYQEFL